MKVTLRKRKLNSGKSTLYLAYYEKGKKRTYEYLEIYLKPGDTVNNKEKLEIAAKIRLERELEIINSKHSFPQENKKDSFLVFFLSLVNKNIENSSYYNWKSAYIHLSNFSNSHLLFSDITEEKLEEFKQYLSNVKKKNSEKKLAQNSKSFYFNKVKQALTISKEKKIIKDNPGENVPTFAPKTSPRDYLTIEELRALLNTECSLDIMKQAFMFSALTGLRWSDIYKMTWGEIVEKTNGTYYMFQQEKTEEPEYLPISSQSLKFLPKKSDSIKVWKGLVYSDANNQKLAAWGYKAGLTMKITFHTARHTFATMQLTYGTDIYTVSKLLGHKVLRSTEVYAKIIDKKKVDAVNNIPLLEIDL